MEKTFYLAFGLPTFTCYKNKSCVGCEETDCGYYKQNHITDTQYLQIFCATLEYRQEYTQYFSVILQIDTCSVHGFKNYIIDEALKLLEYEMKHAKAGYFPFKIKVRSIMGVKE